jgi:hypothetical protein
MFWCLSRLTAHVPEPKIHDAGLWAAKPDPDPVGFYLIAEAKANDDDSSSAIRIETIQCARRSSLQMTSDDSGRTRCAQHTSRAKNVNVDIFSCMHGDFELPIVLSIGG